MEFFGIVKSGLDRLFTPQAVVLLDPGTGNAVGSAAAPFPVSAVSAAYRAQVAIARPANVTPYIAGDVVGSADGGVIEFPAMGPAGGHIMLTSCDLRIDIASVPTGMTSFRLYLYTASPQSAFADNATWSLPAGDRSVYANYIDFNLVQSLGGTVVAKLDGAATQIKLGEDQTALYGYLVTTVGFTPASVSEVYNPCLRAVAV